MNLGDGSQTHFRATVEHACKLIFFLSRQIGNFGLLDLALPSRLQDFFTIWTYVLTLDLGSMGSTGHIYSYAWNLNQTPFRLSALASLIQIPLSPTKV